MPDVPDVPGDAAGLRAANAWLRELLAGRDADVAELRALVADSPVSLSSTQSGTST